MFTRSPHLANVLSRSVDPAALPFLDSCFNLALLHGGESEWDFSRAPDASYNPLPARVALILINDARITRAEILATAMIASVCLKEEDLLTLRSFTEFKHVCALLNLVEQYPSCTMENSEIERDIASIVAALWLDRARHIHLTPHQDKITIWEDFSEMITPIARDTTGARGNLHLLLSTWLERFSLRLEQKKATAFPQK